MRISGLTFAEDGAVPALAANDAQGHGRLSEQRNVEAAN